MFGKKFSEYVQFERWILILITLVFVVRLVTNARWASINLVLLLGLIYCSIAVHIKGFGSYKQLLGLLMTQTVFAHVLIAVGIVIGVVTGADNIYTLPEFFGGNSGRNLLHAGIHVVASFVLSLIAWLFGSVILFVTKLIRR